jgi:hypothetical protein
VHQSTATSGNVSLSTVIGAAANQGTSLSTQLSTATSSNAALSTALSTATVDQSTAASVATQLQSADVLLLVNRASLVYRRQISDILKAFERRLTGGRFGSADAGVA